MASKMSALEAHVRVAPAKACWSPHVKPERSVQETLVPTPRHSLQSPPLLTVTDHLSKEAE